MNIALWIVSGLLAVAFLGAGLMKATKPRAELAEKMTWVENATDGQVKAVGVIEILGALGLILPAVTNIAPILVPLAALGLALTMVGAVAVHLKEGEGPAASAPAIVLGLLAAFVTWGRFGTYAF